jgi:FAD/FMN-containing dehydrogenase
MIEAMQLNGASIELEEEALEDLASDLRGEIIRPDDESYEQARKVWNGMIDRYPALIVRCADTDDVVRAVRFARQRNLLTAVRGGGHNVAGHGTQDGALVIDLSLMREVSVDADFRTVQAQGGATLGDVDVASQERGLAVPLGVVSETGIAGLTLVGGLGWLRNKYGLTVDNLLEAEMVTADGQVVIANKDSNADLLWGLQGGGGNFGIVTRFTYQAYPVGPDVYFMAVFYSAENDREILRAFRDFVAQAPDEVTTLADLGVFPEGSEFPEELQGTPFTALVGMYAGLAGEGERAFAPLRELGKPLLDLSGPKTYVEVQTFFDADYPKGVRYYWKSLNLMELTDEGIDRILEHARQQPSQRSTVDLWPLGGAIKRIPNDATAFFGREATILLNPEANWTDPADDQANIQWVRDLIGSMGEFSDGGRYLNFQGFQEEGDAMMQAAFGASYARLAELKRKYDPDNFFRLNQNIKPAS